MATARLRKVGGSVMVAIPPAMLETARLQAESVVDLSFDQASGMLSVRPAKRRYTLAELLAQCDPDAKVSGDDQAWLDVGAMGSEDI